MTVGANVKLMFVELNFIEKSLKIATRVRNRSINRHGSESIIAN